MQTIDNFLATIKALRSPGGCPWDRAQTHKTIRVNAAEECAELLEAIDLDSVPKMREELGDLLMIIALHCEIAAENNEFTFDDVVREIDKKIIRRHPHVFGDKTAANAEDVLKIWQDVKKEEKKERAIGGVFDGIPPKLSGLRYAYDIVKKAPAGLEEKTNSNIDFNSEKALSIGKKLYDTVKEAVANKIEPEAALRDYLAQLRKNA